jgi:hypothetical protein
MIIHIYFIIIGDLKRNKSEKLNQIRIGTLSLIFLSLVIFYLITSNESEEKQNIVKNEKYYQTNLCKKLNGVIEYKLPDKTRIDCLTDDYAIEIDWAKKWAEGIGQALYYAQQTNKKPAVALIVSEKDERYLKRLKSVADKFKIKIIVIER